MILTKGGQRSERDFDLLTSRDWFGVTLTNLDNILSLRWEPGAALPEERINSLYKAHKKGVKTWVSLEPVLYPKTTLEIIRKTYKFVDTFKVGTLNYHRHARSIDWHRFAADVKSLLLELDAKYYLKEDLRKWL
jgi:DNA repair photolyase